MDGAIPRTAGLVWMHHETVDSTNDLVLAAARGGEASGLWITADRQLKGRGRGGHVWTSEPGNFHGSHLYVTAQPVGALSLLPLAAGLAVRDAVAEILARAAISTQNPHTVVMPGLDPGIHSGTELPSPSVTEWVAGSSPAMTMGLALKWPNDVLVGGRKVAGILLESETLADGRTAVAIGCGINLAHHPAGSTPPATHLAEHGDDCSIADVLPPLARRMVDALDLFEREPARIAEGWLATAHGIGGPVTVRLPSATFSGTFAGLDRSGRLILGEAGGGRRLISAGEVFFGAAEPAGEDAA
jgi:BirA family transcriptional regulator, biotin operon repressor / biotin---[acetyl-CoA-carboxylase] ligase